MYLSIITLHAYTTHKLIHLPKLVIFIHILNIA